MAGKFVLTAQLQLQAPRNVQQVVRQIQNQLNNVHVNVAVQGAGKANKNLRSMNSNVQQVTSSANKMGKAFAVSIKRFAAFSIATRAVGLLTRGLGGAVAEAVEFERELIKVAQVTNKTMHELRGLTNEITRLATTWGVSSKAILSTARILSQAGLTAGETKIALDALAKSELAPTFENITQTAEGAVAIFNQFGKGAEALEGQLGAINAVAGKFAVEAGDLISVIRRTGGVFKNAGGDLNELIALFTSVRSTTRESAESIATGLRTIFTRIQRPRTIEFLKQFGVQLTDLNGKFVGPYEAVRRLSDALAGLEQGDITFIRIAEQLGGFRQIGKVIPLLQQFGVSQEALKVAMEGQDSLAKDAAKAQESLAVRITKVKEEFLALIRTVTESKTFQAMANTALALASALIKVADAVSPLLPMLTALAAIKIGRGIAGFAGGLKGAFGGAKGFNKGGLVPGSGNRDTVPAMLTPGEFVIRKSSVSAIGADNLAGVNRYAGGGVVRINPGAIGGFFLRPEQGDPRDIGVSGNMAITNPKALGMMGQMKGHGEGGIGVKEREAAFLKASKADQAKMLGISEKGMGNKIKKRDMRAGKGRLKSKHLMGGNFAKAMLAGGNIDQFIHGGAATVTKTVPVSGSIKGFFPGGDDMRRNSKVATSVSKHTKEALHDGVMRMVPRVNMLLDNSMINANADRLKESAQRLSNDPNATRTMEGFLLEGLVDAVTGANLGGRGTTWDFGPASIKQAGRSLQNLFGSDADLMSIQRLIKADAKRSASAGAKKSILKKLQRDINKGDLSGVTISKMAKGGPVGTDTVPALLTPGEFVVNKKSSQAIGYGNLARMNRYAAGGKVSVGRHAYGSGIAGTGMTFSQDRSQSAIPAKLNTFGQALSKAGMSADKTVQVLRKFGASLNTGVSNHKALNQALKGTGLAATRMKGTTSSNTKASTGNTKAVNQNSAANKRSSKNMQMMDKNSKGMGMGMGMNVMMLASFAQGIGDAETASGKMVNSLMETVMQLGMVGMALEMFGVKLSMQSFMPGGMGTGMGKKMFGTKFFGKKGGQLLGRGAKVGGFKGGAMQLAGKGSIGIGKAGGRLAKALGPLALVTAGFWALSKGIDSYQDFQGKATRAIEEGNVAKAEENAALAAGATATNTMGYGAIAAGAAIGSVVPVVGTVTGALIGAGIALASKFVPGVGEFVHSIGAWMGIVDDMSVIKAEAGLRAQNTRAMKAQKKMTDEVAEAMDDLASGTTTLDQAMNNAVLANAMAEGTDRAKKAQDVRKGLEGQKSYGAARDTFSLLSFGTVESNETRNRGLQERIDKNKEEQKSFDRESIKQMDPLTRKVLKQQSLRVAAAGGKISEDPQGDEQVLANLRASGEAGKELAETLERDARSGGKALRQYTKSLNNMVEEQKKFIKYLAAMNLGMRDVSSVAAASAMNLGNLIDSFSVGFQPLENSIKVVEMAMTDAGSKISAGEFGKAMGDVQDTLKHFGATDKEIAKFTESTKGVHHLQSRFSTLFNEQFKSKLATGEFSKDPNTMKAELEKVMLADLREAGFGEATIAQFSDIFAGIDASELDIDAIMAGDFSSATKMFEKLGEEATKKLMEIAKQRIEMEKKMIQLTQQRIAAERNHMEMMKKAVDMRMEAAEISARHGGAAFDNATKRNMLLERANVGAGQMGLGNLTTGSLGDLRNRNLQIGQNFAGIERRRGVEGGMSGRQGVEDDARQKDLMKANAEHAKLIRDLIRLEEDELKILQKKNELEKQSLEALAKGDLESFLKQQAAVGATAAVATGDSRMMGLFGADALSGAFQNIKSQQEAGVQTLFGRRVSGAGGLLEQSASASLGSRGLNDLRSAQVMAGTTPAEEAQRRKIRGLAGELSATGQMAADMAGMQVHTAEIKIDQATIEMDRLAADARAQADKQNRRDRADAAAAAGLPAGGNRWGGMIYANNGIFVPRGSDTVPAMLTPGEFVVRKEAVQRGNNLRMLRAINTGATGESTGAGGYYRKGGKVSKGTSVGLNTEVVNNLSSSLTQFNTSLSDNIKRLENLKFQIKLDTTNVNVNLNGTSFLAQLKDNLKEELMAEVSQQIKGMNFNMAGEPAQTNSVLNTA